MQANQPALPPLPADNVQPPLPTSQPPLPTGGAPPPPPPADEPKVDSYSAGANSWGNFFFFF